MVFSVRFGGFFGSFLGLFFALFSLFWLPQAKGLFSAHFCLNFLVFKDCFSGAFSAIWRTDFFNSCGAGTGAFFHRLAVSDFYFRHRRNKGAFFKSNSNIFLRLNSVFGAFFGFKIGSVSVG